MTTGEVPGLKVDPEMLAQLGNVLKTSADAIPEPPPAFVVTGADAISRAIATKLPDIENVIQEGLPQVKTDAQTTAANIIAAADKYLGTDAQLAANYEKYQFDGAGSSGAGAGTPSAASSGVGSPSAANHVGSQSSSMGQLGQMMSTPMQMAGQAAQMPMQMLGAVASAPQGAMQGVQSAMQQIGKITEGLGGDKGTPTEVDPKADAVGDREDKGSDKPEDAQRPLEQKGAAAGPSHGERPPATGGAPEHQTPAPPPRHVPAENLPGTALTAEPEGRIDL